VQQAAYSLIEDEHKQEVHLKIGQLLLADTPETEREERIFDLVNHLNIAKDLISDQLEKKQLAELNLTAGRKAKASTAYQAAFAYLQAGIGLLDERSWYNYYDLTLALYTEAAEAVYLSGKIEAMERLMECVLEHANTLLDKVRVHELTIRHISLRID
jgi:predicted ATPase